MQKILVILCICAVASAHRHRLRYRAAATAPPEEATTDASAPGVVSGVSAVSAVGGPSGASAPSAPSGPELGGVPPRRKPGSFMLGLPDGSWNLVKVLWNQQPSGKDGQVGVDLFGLGTIGVNWG